MTTITDLIERLRGFEDIDPDGEELMLQAADLLEAQAKQIEHWKAARESAMFAGEEMKKQMEALQAKLSAQSKLK